MITHLGHSCDQTTVRVVFGCFRPAHPFRVCRENSIKLTTSGLDCPVGVQLGGKGCKPARLDRDGTAKPLTRLVGHARVGDCVGPGTVKPDALEDTETGVRIILSQVTLSRKW